MFVTILSQSFLTLVSRHFMSFSLLSAWHNSIVLNYFLNNYLLTFSIKVFAGLNAGIE